MANLHIKLSKTINKEYVETVIGPYPSATVDSDGIYVDIGPAFDQIISFVGSESVIDSDYARELGIDQIWSTAEIITK